MSEVADTTINARRISRHMRALGFDVVSETYGQEVRVSLEVLGKPAPWSIVVHCQADAPVQQVEAGLRGWVAHYEAQLADDAAVFSDSGLEAAVATLGRAEVLDALRASVT